MNQEIPLHFGISLPQNFDECEEVPSCFEWLELPGSVLKNADETLEDCLEEQDFNQIFIRNLLDADLSAGIGHAEDFLVSGYKSELRRMLETANNFHATQVSLDPDWETLYTDPEATKVFADILRSVSGDLEYYEITLNLTIRMPGSGTVPPGKSLEFLNKLPGNRIRLIPDIHPHELLNSPPDWQDVLTPFRFAVDTVRFAYESELGNRLLYAHLEKTMQALATWKRELNLMFAPSGRADYQELATLADTILQRSRGMRDAGGLFQ